MYELRNGNGSGSILKVSKVDANGGIVSAQIIKFGVDYGDDFTNSLVSYTDRSSAPSNTLTISLPNIIIGDVYSGIIESGIINRHNYNNDTSTSGPAFDPTYAGEILREFYYDNSQPSDEKTIPAIIYVSTDGMAKYPGYYSTNDGFLDDAVYLQDSYYYQAFSYVIKVDEQLESYKSILKTLLHPSGMAVFGEYDVRNTFDLGASLQEASRTIILTFQEEVFTSTSEPIKNFVKSLTETVTPTESISKNLTKYTSDSVSTSSSGVIWAGEIYWDISYALNDTGFYVNSGIVQQF